MESGGDKNHLNEKHLLSQLKAGKDQKMWVEKGLEIIEMSHENEVNSSVRYSLIENSSKLLKKEIDAKKAELEGEIKASMELVV